MRLSIINLILLFGILQIGCKSNEPIVSYQKRKNNNIYAELYSDQKFTQIYSNLDHYIIIRKKLSLDVMDLSDSCVLSLFIGINHYDYFNDSFKVCITRKEYDNINDTIIKAHITATIETENSIKKGRNLIYYKLINNKFSFSTDDSGKKILTRHKPEVLLFNERSFTYAEEMVVEKNVTETVAEIKKSVGNKILATYNDTVDKMLEKQNKLNNKYRAFPVNNAPAKNTYTPTVPPKPTPFSSNVSTNDYLIANPNLYSYTSNMLIPNKEFFLEIDYQKKKAIQCDSFYVTTSSEEERLIIDQSQSKQLFQLSDTLAHTYTITFLKLINTANQSTPSSFIIKTKLMCRNGSGLILLSEEEKTFYVGQRITVKQ